MQSSRSATASCQTANRCQSDKHQMFSIVASVRKPALHLLSLGIVWLSTIALSPQVLSNPAAADSVEIDVQELTDDFKHCVIQTVRSGGGAEQAEYNCHLQRQLLDAAVPGLADEMLMILTGDGDGDD